MAASGYDFLYKIVMVGDEQAGKTSLLDRFCQDKFSVGTKSTIGVEFGDRNVEVDGKNIKLQIWDTSGQERSRTLTRGYYRGAVGYFVVYDPTFYATLMNTRIWLKEVMMHGVIDAPIFLVGTKCDQEEDIKIKPEDVEALIKEFKNASDVKEFIAIHRTKGYEPTIIPLGDTSAKTGEGVDRCFTQAVEQIYARLNTVDSPSLSDKSAEAELTVSPPSEALKPNIYSRLKQSRAFKYAAGITLGLFIIGAAATAPIWVPLLAALAAGTIAAMVVSAVVAALAIAVLAGMSAYKCCKPARPDSDCLPERSEGTPPVLEQAPWMYQHLSGDPSTAPASAPDSWLGGEPAVELPRLAGYDPDAEWRIPEVEYADVDETELLEARGRALDVPVVTGDEQNDDQNRFEV